VSSHFHHPGEELVYRGVDGSGIIFFTSCNMRCAFCQNAEQRPGGATPRTEGRAEVGQGRRPADPRRAHRAPPGSTIEQMLADYQVMRDQARARERFGKWAVHAPLRHSTTTDELAIAVLQLEATSAAARRHYMALVG
jgi:pyruvate-formate lyase-activating enzyme